MELKRLNPDQLQLAYETDLREAFPPAELKPLSAMTEMMARGVYEALALYEEGDAAPLGYVLLWKHVDGRYLLIDYLCVPARRRNGGIGAKLLHTLFDAYPPETVFIGESEAPTGDEAADEMILRRLGFYERNGTTILGYDTALRRPLQDHRLVQGGTAVGGGDPPEAPGDLPGALCRQQAREDDPGAPPSRREAGGADRLGGGLRKRSI